MTSNSLRPPDLSRTVKSSHVIRHLILKNFQKLSFLYVTRVSRVVHSALSSSQLSSNSQEKGGYHTFFSFIKTING